MVFHFHNREGREARKRWNFTCCSDVACNIMSSPLIETSPANFLTRRVPSAAGTDNSRLTGGRSRRRWSSPDPPGRHAWTTCWGVNRGPNPNTLVKHPISHETTCTHQAFPTRDRRASEYPGSARWLFGRQGCVYPAGSPIITSRSKRLATRKRPLRWVRQLESRYWYGGNRWRSSSQRVSSWGVHWRRPAGFLPGVGDGREVVNVGKRCASFWSFHPGSKKSPAEIDAVNLTSW